MSGMRHLRGPFFGEPQFWCGSALPEDDRFWRRAIVAAMRRIAEILRTTYPLVLQGHFQSWRRAGKVIPKRLFERFPSPVRITELPLLP